MPKTKTTFRYAVSPDCVRHISGLSLLAKTLYIDILKLSSKKGYCWASNSYFSGLYKVHPMTVSKEIAELKKQGIIVTEMVTGKGVKTARKIVPIEPEKLQHSLASRLRTPKCSDLEPPKCSDLGLLSVYTEHNKPIEESNTKNKVTAGQLPENKISTSDKTMDFSDRKALNIIVENLLAEKIPRKSMLPETQAAVIFWFSEQTSKGKKSDVPYYLMKLQEKLKLFAFDDLILAIWIIEHSSWLVHKDLGWGWAITHEEPKIDMALASAYRYDCNLPAKDFQIITIHRVEHLLTNPSKLYVKAGISTGKKSKEKQLGHTLDKL